MALTTIAKLFDDLLFDGGELVPFGFLIFNQLIHEPINAAQFSDGFFGNDLFIGEMLIAVDDHAELRAPIADVI